MSLYPITHYLATHQSNITEITVPAAKQAIDDGAALIDVRSESEYLAGAPKEAIFIGRDYLEWKILEAITDPQQPIIVMCAAGARALFAAKAIQDLGYQQVSVLKGGYNEWLASLS